MILATHRTPTSAKPLATPYFPDRCKRVPNFTYGFHPDTMFDPTWIDGSHVLTFDEQGIIPTAKAAAAGRPGYSGTPSPAIRQLRHTLADLSTPESSSTSSDFTCPSSPTTVPSTLISAEEQTEQDDAELEELMIPGCLHRQLLSAAYADALGATAPASASMSATVEENGKGVLDALAAEAGHRGSPDDENSTEIGNKALTTPSANTFAPSSTSDTSHSDEFVDIYTPPQHVPFKVLEECRSCRCIDDVGDLRFGQGEELENEVIELERLREKAPPPLRLGDDIVAEEADVEWSCVLLKEDAGGVDADERTLVCSEVSEQLPNDKQPPSPLLTLEKVLPPPIFC